MLPILSKSGYKLAMEMIDFQNDNFGERLEIAVGSIRKLVVDKTHENAKLFEGSKEVENLVEIIYKRLGLKVEVISDGLDAAILPFYPTTQHILLHESLRGDLRIKDQEKILKNAKNKKGYVDSKNAKISGVFSEYENSLHLNFEKLFNVYKMNDPEVVAVILHELGHGFAACEYSDRLETNNQILSNLAETIAAKKEKTDVAYVFRELEKVNPKVTEEEVDKLVHGGKTVAGYTWFKIVVGSVEEQLKNSKYAETSFEQLADNFAARFNYGRPLITALEKLYAVGGYSPEKSRGWMTFFFIMNAIFFITNVAAIIASLLLIGNVVSGLYSAFIAWVVLRTSGEDMVDYTYDELKLRYTRVRHQMVEILKDANLKADKAKDVLDDIYLLDRVIKDTYQFTTLTSVIANFVFSDARKAKSSIEEQQLLEELAHSNLFVKSKELALA